MKFICEQCGSEFFRKPSKTPRFCSRQCRSNAVKGIERPDMRGRIPWNKGITASDDQRVANIANAKIKNVVDRDTLYQLYVIEKLPLSTIGEQYNVSKHVIKRLTEQYQLERIQPLRETLTYEIAAKLYAQGFSMVDIAKQFECSSGHVKAIIPDIDKRHNRNRAGVVPDASILRSLYWDEWLSYEKIGERLSVDFTTIPYWLKKFNIPRRNQWETRRGKDWVEPDSEVIYHLYTAEYLSIQSIADILIIPSSAVKKTLKGAGVHLRKTGYPNVSQYTAKDGHKVKSGMELQVDDWLYEHGIEHTYEPQIGASPYRADFLIGNMYVEIWGIEGNERYEQKRKKKLEAYRRFDLNLLSVYRKDFPDLHVLEPLLEYSV